MTTLSNMNLKMKDSLTNMRNMFLEKLYDSNDNDIDNFLLFVDNKNIEEHVPVLINYNFKNLIVTDGTRNQKNQNYKGLKLEPYYNQKIKPIEICNAIKKNWSQSPSSGNYKNNANPVWFILFFDEFYGMELNNYKGETMKLTFSPRLITIDGKEYIAGITIDNSEKLIGDKFLRSEIINCIEIYTSLLIHPCTLNYMGQKAFLDAFLYDTHIQYHIVAKNAEVLNKYIDMAILFNGYELLFEHLESFHKFFTDYFRDLDIMLSSGRSIIPFRTIDMNTPASEQKFIGIYHQFCKILYDAKMEESAIAFYMVELSTNNYSPEKAITGVKIVRDTLDLSLDDIKNLSFFEKELPIDMDKVIDKIGYQFDSNDFKNGNDIFDDVNLIPDFELDSNIPLFVFVDKFKLVSRLEAIKSKKTELKLTKVGIMKILTNFPNEMWSKKNEFLQYLVQIQDSYIETVADFLKGNKEQGVEVLKERANEYRNILEHLKMNPKMDEKEYFTKLQAKMEIARRQFAKFFHPRLPFLRVSRSGFVEYDNYCLINEKYKANDVKLTNGVKNVEVDNDKFKDVLNGYAIMSPSEINALYNKTPMAFAYYLSQSSNFN